MNNPALDKAVEALRPQLEQTLAAWIRIPSVKDAPQPGAPFGADVRRMLDRAIEDGRALLGNARDVDGYACDMEIGQGEDVIGILAHLDVVPAGDGWQVDPFGAQVVGGKMYGRGTSDDKGPAVAALYAMKAVQDAGIPLGKRVRLILGCDEESGMEDIAYYDKAIGLPAVGFSPDAEFPVINTEKGILQMRLHAPLACDRLVSIQAGTRPNVVPGTATAVVRGEDTVQRAAAFAQQADIRLGSEPAEGGAFCLTVTGVPAHASTPWQGVNAAGQLLRVLQAAGVGGDCLSTLADAIGHDSDGTGLGIAGSDGVSGPLTVNLGLLSYDGQALQATLDCRYPVFFSDAQIVRFVKLRLSGVGFEVETGHGAQPHHVPASSFIVQTLLKVYGELSGREAKVIAIGGGTYARCMKQAVAFGPLFPGEEELAHQAGENVDLAQLMLSVRIFAYAIAELAGV